ncbi:hypothetical protein C5167_005145 [Papaver somniferum]|uniref:PPIase cyclophilin-type domain-containing protein n=1 Tax=Papaver somniferum TaxID=3469 RepID=A0A4Y7JCQ9_PAPSO|nr:hypothetical protein C5167_005145 [Papaver somniferum]
MGEMGKGVNGKELHYKGVPFHQIISGFVVQGGDIAHGDGKGTESIFGGTFPDENFKVKHSHAGIVSMVNSGPDSNGSQFFITTVKASYLEIPALVFSVRSGEVLTPLLAVAKQIKDEIKIEVLKMKDAIGVVPGLAVILVGDRKDSATYVRNKKKACEAVGIRAVKHFVKMAPKGGLDKFIIKRPRRLAENSDGNEIESIENVIVERNDEHEHETEEVPFEDNEHEQPEINVTEFGNEQAQSLPGNVNIFNPAAWDDLDIRSREVLVENGLLRDPMLENGPKNRFGRHFSSTYYTRHLPNGEKEDRQWLAYSKELDRHMDEARILNAVTIDKDVDEFHPLNIGLLAKRALFCFIYGITIKGKRAVIIGRSNIVGLPVSLLRQREDAIITIVHSRTENPEEIVRQADIIVSAVGKAKMVRGSWIKPGAVIIDVGINPIDDPESPRGYRLVGDVCYDEACKVASAITPVSGGVGMLTIAMLLSNTLSSAKRALKFE